MTLQEQLKRAIDIAIDVHAGQYDKNGQPYINHVFRVMNAGHTIQEKIVGALHDVVEDSDTTIDDLKSEGFTVDVMDAVHAMTHYDTETYDNYIERVMQNTIATRVKIYDLTDNMDLRRLESLNDVAVSRLKRYLSAYNKIINSFK